VNRRSFIDKSIKGIALGATFGQFSFSQDKINEEYEKLVLLHTNDTHSRLDPFDSGDFKGLGGVAARKTIIDKIRTEEKNVLLVDAGDIFQGTPYFNMFLGELEIKAMSMLGYDAATMGNHDFDAGLENFGKQMQHANFPFIVSNYDFSDTILHNKIAPYKIIKKGKIKIGIFGLGIELDGLVHKDLYLNTQYQDPVSTAKKWATYLKQEEKCDIVILLSHLGYSYNSGKKISDVVLSEIIDNVDVVIGGHTHTFLKSPDIIKNNFGKFVIVNQVGWGGINLGRLDIYLQKETGNVIKNDSFLLKCQ
jgi:5'-nucleotidase